jgi:hypothetical protein
MPPTDRMARAMRCTSQGPCVSWGASGTTGTTKMDHILTTHMP